MSSASVAFTPPEPHPAIRSLGTRKQWVAWRYGERNGAATKIPMSVKTGLGASSTRPADWTSYEQAVAFASARGMAGVGYVVTEDDGITGVDLDKCRDPDTGDVELWAREILDLAETYAELSPSGRGIRMFWEGKIASTVKADAAHVEIYASKRYLTVTGRHVPGTPTEIRPAPLTERLLLERVRTARGEPAPADVRSQLRENEDGTAVDLATGECFDSLAEAEATLRLTAPIAIPPAAIHVLQKPAMARTGDDFFATINARALAALPAWVPGIFPSARYHASTGAYRVSSRDLGRDLEEDLSIASNGIVDFGVADMGDARQGKRSAIDLVMEYGVATDAAGAALWLCERIGIVPEAIGWRAGADDETEALGRAAVERMASGKRTVDMPAKPTPDPMDLWSTLTPPELPIGVLPAVIEEFALLQGDLMGADPAGLAMAALTTCAALIPDRITLRMKRHDTWTESARLWCALIGAPSTMKTPIVNAAVRPLVALDKEQARANRESMRNFEEMKAAGEKPSKPRQPRLRIEDVTTEKAQEILADSPNGLLAIQDELSGWFGSMERYSGAKGGQKDRSFWLQSFNGGDYIVSRIGRGDVYIDNLSVCLLGGIQPDLIRKLLGDTYDDGLFQRILPIVLRPATHGRDEAMPNIVSQYGWLAQGLHRMQRPVTGGTGNLAGNLETDLVFDDAAQEVFRDAMKRHHGLAVLEVVNRKLASAIGKYNGLFGRLAIVFHCIEYADRERPPRVVTADTAHRVDAFMQRFLMPHAMALYRDVVGISDDHDLLVEVAGFLLAHPEINEVTFRTFARGSSMMRRCKDRKDAEAVLERLDAIGWLDQKPIERNQKSNRWAVVPRIHVLFADRAKTESDRRQMMKDAITAAYAQIEESDDRQARKSKLRREANRRYYGEPS